MKLAILIVTYNSETTIEQVLGELQSQEFEHSVFVLDNASSDRTVELLNRHTELTLIESQTNLGFCLGNNLLLNRAYQLGFTHFLFLNPDAAPLPGALTRFAEAVENSTVQAFTPKIIRCTNSLGPITPRIIDAAGIYFTSNFRHLDRGSGELDQGQYDNPGFVEGGTGAALLVTRHFVEKVSFIRADQTFEFFDERFFAYREDAELALRAKRYGLKYWYTPNVVFSHVRKVIPDRRNQLSPFLNALSVRNRLLLLLSHYSFKAPLLSQISTLIRNLQVFVYAVVFESESRKLLVSSLSQLSSHLERRKQIARTERV